MTVARRWAAALALVLLVPMTGCKTGGVAATADDPSGKILTVTIRSANGAHPFKVETAKTEAAQQQGLMFRTDIAPNGGMLFAPYPPSGPPREASFWMRNTPTPLDIIFIRPDGTIARIAENTVPQSETPIPSGEPVSAVLEIRGGRSLDLGIAEGDTVDWPGRPAT